MLAPARAPGYAGMMSLRRFLAAVILSPTIVGLSACGDDLAEPEATAAACDASRPFRVADLPAGFSDYLRVTGVGDHLYINVHPIFDDTNPYNNARPGFGAIVGGQTWVTGQCGEDAVLVGEGWAFDLEGESLGALTPVFRGQAGADIDPSLACDVRGERGDRTYRVDLTGTSQPELLLEGWACQIDVAHMVTTRRIDETTELWRVPQFPELAGAVRLAADIHTEVGRDADHRYFLDSAQALHAVDLGTGADEILETGVLRATGGATNFAPFVGPGGPTRLLWLAQRPGEAQAVYLYRGETGEVVALADAGPGELSEPPLGGWAWGFDSWWRYIHHQPYGDPGGFLRVFDLDGAPLTFPPGVRADRPWFLPNGVVGSVDGPQGPRWVFARPGVTEATALDIPWDPELQIVTANADELFYFLDDDLYRTPLDGGPTTAALDYGYHYADDAMLLHHDGLLIHVDRSTDASEVLLTDVGTYAPVGDVRDGVYEPRGIFYTDVASPKTPSLWFMPQALLPGAQ